MLLLCIISISASLYFILARRQLRDSKTKNAHNKAVWRIEMRKRALSLASCSQSGPGTSYRPRGHRLLSMFVSSVMMFADFLLRSSRDANCTSDMRKRKSGTSERGCKQERKWSVQGPSGRKKTKRLDSNCERHTMYMQSKWSEIELEGTFCFYGLL